MQKQQTSKYPYNPQIDRFINFIPFGDSIMNSSIKEVKLKDGKGNKINLKYNKEEESVEQLLDKFTKERGGESSEKFDLKSTKGKVIKKSSHIEELNSDQEFQMVLLADSSIQSKFQQEREQEQFRIKITTHQNKTFEVKASGNQTVQKLKEYIFNYTNINPALQKLIFQGKRLPNVTNLYEHGIKDGSTINLSIEKKSGIFKNMQIFVNYKQKDKTLTIKVEPSNLIQEVKEIISLKANLQVKQQKLTFAGKDLNDNMSLSDLNIGKHSTLYLSEKTKLEGKGFQESSKMMLPGQQQQQHVPLTKIIMHNNVLSFDLLSQEIEELCIKKIAKNKAEYLVQIELDQRKQIVCTPDFCFYTSQNQWKVCDKESPNSLKVGDRIRNYHERTIQVKNITYLSKEEKKIINVKLEENKPYYINSILVKPAIEVNFKLELSQKVHVVKVHGDKSVADLKKIIQQVLEISLKNQILMLKSGTKLYDKDKIKQYQTDNYLEIAIIQESKKKQHEKQNKKKIILKIDQNTFFEINYSEIAGKQINKILPNYIYNSRPSYCIIYGEQLLKPDDKINKIEKYFGESQQLMVVLLKSPEKYFLSRYFKDAPFKPNEAKFENSLLSKVRALRQTNKNKSFLSQDEKTVIYYYSCNLFYNETQKLLHNVLYSNIQTLKKCDSYLYLCKLFQIFGKIEKCYGECYKGITEFNFSKYHKAGEIFVWRNFISTSTNKNFIQQKISKKGGTLFKIKSLTGRRLSTVVKSEQKQIVFLPFTYFIIEEIIENKDYQQVWLSEMASPVEFKKNLVLWVDDNPTGNLQEINNILRSNIEVVQLTSTSMAEQWMREFGWILNWKQIKLRIISDMVRQQKDKKNFFAGLDLLEKIFNFWGYTTPILIYCGDKEEAKNNATKRNIKAGRIYRIDNEEGAIYDFCELPPS